MRSHVLSVLRASTWATLTLSGAAAAAEPATLAIVDVRLFDGESVVERANVLVAGERIVAAGAGVVVPEGVEVVDGSGKTLLPGLIDAHVHVYAGEQLEQSLAFGVTTVLDMFSIPATATRLREEDRADRAGLLSAGILATAPGGHGTQYGFPIPTISKPEEAPAFVDARLAEGSDYLKIVHDGGAAYGKPMPTIDEATLRALVEAAQERKVMALVHTGTYAEARAAIDAGADGLVHLFRDRPPADDFGATVARRGAFVTPTLAVLRTLTGGRSTIGDDPALSPFLGPEAKAGLARKFELSATAAPGTVEKAIAQLRDAKVPILCGTDAPNPGTAFGASMHDELALLVEAGLSPTTALAGATARAAERFGLADRGRIAPGRRADLLLVDGDPTTTITDSRRIVAIWRGGVKFDRAGYRARVDAASRAAAANLAAPLPDGAGPISDFEDGTTGARFGQAWSISTDAMIGGKSSVELSVVDVPGKTKALAIAGEVVAGAPSTWSGAIFSPGARPFTAVDLSSKSGFRFRARSDDGGGYVVMLFSQKRGRAPLVRPFTAPQEGAELTFAWSDFDGYDGGDTLAIFLGRAAPGAFRLLVDDVELLSRVP